MNVDEGHLIRRLNDSVLWREKYYPEQKQRDQEAGRMYGCIKEFVLKNGTLHSPSSWDGRFHKGPAKRCFENAFRVAAESGLKLVEGFAITKTSGEPVRHAWNLDEDGLVVDVTWSDKGLAYLGVEFSLGRAYTNIARGIVSILEDWEDGNPLLSELWTGENWRKKWPKWGTPAPNPLGGAFLEKSKRSAALKARRLAAAQRLAALIAKRPGSREYYSRPVHLL